MTSSFLTTADLVILSLIIVSILIGVLRGLIKESISLVTWVLAIVLAGMFASPLAQHLTFTKEMLIRTVCAFTLIFVSTVFVGALINYMIGTFVRKTPFNTADRILGSVFGLLRGMVFVTVLILIAGLTPLPETPKWQQSFFVARFEGLAIWLKDSLPQENAQWFHFPNENKNGQESQISLMPSTSEDKIIE